MNLPPELQAIHNAFHVSNLRKCLSDEQAKIPYEEVTVSEKLQFQEEPEAILDRKTKKLRNKEVKLVKVQWRYHKGAETTWEPEDEMRKLYPKLFLPLR